MDARNVKFAVISMAVAVIFAGALQAEVPLEPGSTNRVPLRVSATGVVTVRVIVNGTGPYEFIVDTGSNRTAVTSRLATRLGLPAVAKTDVVTATSTETQVVTRLDALGVGSVMRREHLAAVLPDTALASLGIDADGLLGQDFLAEQNYTLDYVRGQLTWDVPPTNDKKDVRLRLRREEGRFLAALPQSQDRETLWFVPDSGAQALVLFDRGGLDQLTLLPLGNTRTSTVLGASAARASLVKLLQVGPVTLRDLPAVVINHPDAHVDGLLPLATFAKVTFLGSDQTLIVQAR
jgi:predicted aspartyl protease